ncbi:MAG TPA: diguanylate cyclase, partial [Actinobacteria bacterium]|nr:diguanylate cyclase [Actinomycetes bacterium]HEX21152.1 diguanylate cyclase [Actinomycetota bacterium]
NFIDKNYNIYNKTYIIKLIRLCISKQERNQQDFTIALIKIDHWKFNLFALNLKNKITKETAKAIRGNIRLVDELGHVGGGVFCLIMPETGLSNANIALNRIRKLTLKQLNIFIPLKDKRFSLKVSLLGYPKDAEVINHILDSQAIPDFLEDNCVKTADL